MLALSVYFSSCYTVLYTANQPNMPLFKSDNKQQIKAEASFGTAGMEGKIAYSPVKHLGLFFNGSFLTKNERKQYFREVGIGGYSNIDKSIVFEMYGGYGYGTSSDTAGLVGVFSEFSRSSYGAFNRWFLQSNIGYVTNNFEGGFAMRISNVKFTTLKDSYIPSSTSECTFFEPSLVGKIGNENLKFFGSVTFPMRLSGTPLFGFDTYTLTMGVQGAISF
ncbi:MAG: hypothetical protein LWX07_08250 [Bacteroidetes bacterium]|nr:hypothetical protein [Bacteroidota bacterium]